MIKRFCSSLWPLESTTLLLVARKCRGRAAMRKRGQWAACSLQKRNRALAGRDRGVRLSSAAGLSDPLISEGSAGAGSLSWTVSLRCLCEESWHVAAVRSSLLGSTDPSGTKAPVLKACCCEGVGSQSVLFRVRVRQDDVADHSVQFCAGGDELAEGAARRAEGVELGGR